MGLDFTFTGNQTELNEEEKEGLKLKYIDTHAELNEYEQENIESAISWSMNKRFDMDDILSEVFLKKFHYMMFKDVWRWAGEYRNTNKNIGIDKTLIKNQIIMAIDDCRYQIKNSVYEPDEIAIRFKHKLVYIHPFCNGNGRFSRLVADLLIKNVYSLPYYSWGANESNRRKKYLESLKLADNYMFEKLVGFARN